MRHTGKIAWGFAALWLLGYEFFALVTHRETLSYAMYDMTRAFGALPFLLGVIVGGLAVHFWWHWKPQPIKRSGESNSGQG